MSLTAAACACCIAVQHSSSPNHVSAARQGKRHQQNLAKRAAREAADKPAQPAPNKRASLRKVVKIGRPGYRVTKQYDAETDQRSLLFQARRLPALPASYVPDWHTAGLGPGVAKPQGLNKDQRSLLLRARPSSRGGLLP